MKNATKLIAIFALLTVATFGQTILSNTTLGAAITSATQTNIQLASTSTMLSRGAANQIDTVIYVDREMMNVITVVDSTHVTVQRGVGTGQAGRRTTHANGAYVFFSITSGTITAPSYFGGNTQANGEISGSCTATSLQMLPLIYPTSGDIFDCLGGIWTIVNKADAPTVGATVASATTIAPTGIHFKVSGTTAVATITVPHGFAPGMCLQIDPTGIFATTTAGNIGLITSATVVGRILFMCYDGSKFWPSYVS